MFKIFLAILFLSVIPTGRAEEDQSCMVGLDLTTAWERVVAYAPSLAAAESEIEIGNANKWQARLRPNPIFIIEGENLGVSKRNRGADPPQTTYAISQLIELGGKRFARFALAAGEQQAACWAAHSAKLDLRLCFVRSYLKCAYAQEKLRLSQSYERLACATVEAVGCQVDCAKCSPLMLKKNQLTHSATQLHTKEAEAELAHAHKELASLWGSLCPDFAAVTFNFFTYPPPPCFEKIVDCMEQTPDFACVANGIRLARKDLDLQRSNRVPDLNLIVGFRTYSESHAHGGVIGVELPIPCLNANQGNIRRASIAICQAEYILEEWVRQWHEKVALICDRLGSLWNACLFHEQQMLVEARETYELTLQGYHMGKIDFFELLEAEENLYQIEEQYLDILYEYHLDQAELVRLMGLS